MATKIEILISYSVEIQKTLKELEYNGGASDYFYASIT